MLLRDYEVAVERAASAGLDIVSQNYQVHWDYLQSVFFSTTILTTIGKANDGRLFLCLWVHSPSITCIFCQRNLTGKGLKCYSKTTKLLPY